MHHLFDPGPYHVVLIRPGTPWTGLAKAETTIATFLSLCSRTSSSPMIHQIVRHHSCPLDQFKRLQSQGQQARLQPSCLGFCKAYSSSSGKKQLSTHCVLTLLCHEEKKQINSHNARYPAWQRMTGTSRKDASWTRYGWQGWNTVLDTVVGDVTSW